MALKTTVMIQPNRIKRSAGVLLHISSLPSGNFRDANQFIDFLSDIGAGIWQTLPLNMPHDDGSPYQCLSAHAGNPALISLAKLVELRWIASDETELGTMQALAIAYNRFYKQLADQSEFSKFCRKHAHWLNDFALFYALRNHFNHISWNTWPDAYKNRDKKSLKQFKANFSDEIALIKFTQFVFFKQWHDIKQYAHLKKVKLFGDIPIFVAYDSADVWAHRHLFKLTKKGTMRVVAGVPPDYFSATGQRWGNPHYHWRNMRKDGFAWWLQRMATQKQMFDMVRIDHFRGLESAWEIPEHAETAVEGAWILAPGDALLKAIKIKFPRLLLIAEDLGVITSQVDALRHKYALPGMKILQFAFGGDDTNPYLPHNIDENSVVYTGTHDNDTTLGWALQLDEDSKNHVARVLGETHMHSGTHMHSETHLHSETQVIGEINADMPQALIALALNSKACAAIIPMQDILGLDGAHRMNTPGTVVGNWQWQFQWSQLSQNHVQSIQHAITLSQR